MCVEKQLVDRQSTLPMPWWSHLRLRLSPGEEQRNGTLPEALPVGLLPQVDLGWSSCGSLLKARMNSAEGGVGAGRWTLEVGGGDYVGDKGGECDYFCDTMFDRLKEVEIKSRDRVFVELKGEARVRAVYLLF